MSDDEQDIEVGTVLTLRGHLYTVTAMKDNHMSLSAVNDIQGTAELVMLDTGAFVLITKTWRSLSTRVKKMDFLHPDEVALAPAMAIQAS